MNLRKKKYMRKAKDGPKDSQPSKNKKSNPRNLISEKLRKIREERLKLEGRPDPSSKLTHAIREEFCGYIERGATDVNACGLLNLNIGTLNDWKQRGEVELYEGVTGFYGQFMTCYRKAKSRRELAHVEFIAASSDWKARRWLLSNQDPDNWAMVRTKIDQTLGGPNGGAIPVEVSGNPFQVNFVLAGEQNVDFKIIEQKKAEDA